MNKQPETKICVQCGAGELVRDVRDIPFEYRGRKTVVHAVAGLFCSQCGEGYLDDAAAFSTTIGKFAQKVDTADARILARVRRKLKLTQVEAARLTGGGPNAFSRYERGKAKPMPAVVNLFKLLEKHPELLAELRKA